METPPSIAKLIENWALHGLRSCEGVSASQIDAFERQHDTLLPAEMRQYFRTTDGMDLSVLDDDRAIRFWPLRDVKPVWPEYSSNEAGYDKCFVFADYLLESHHYAIYLGGPRRESVVIVAEPFPLRVASSFSEFVEKYVQDFRSLFSATDPIAL